jgi:ABC-type amino acid transport substrate-binding protein
VLPQDAPHRLLEIRTPLQRNKNPPQVVAEHPLVAAGLCLELVQNEAVDAVSTDDVILTGMIIQDDSLEMVGDRLTTEPYGAGMKEGEREWQAFVNGVLKKVEEDGRWEETYEKWVGRHVGREQQPPTMTLQQALELGQ